MAGIGENEVPFDLVSSLLDYIKTLDFPGAVLGFLPGRSQIFSPLKQLQPAAAPCVRGPELPPGPARRVLADAARRH